jgi:TonB-linked SusC/RagA family outer membrane protein
MLRQALVTNQQVSVTGGGEKSSYSFSLGYYHQDGLVKHTDFDRYTMHFSNDLQLTNFLKVGVNTTTSFSKSKDAPGGIFYEIFNAAPIVPVYYADGSYGDAGDYNIAAANQKNPQATLDFYNQHSKTWKINGGVYAEAKFLKYFTFRTSGGGDYEQGEGTNYSPYTNYLYVPVAYRNRYSTLTKTRDENRNWIVENTLSFDKKFNDHSVKVLLGQGAQEYRYYGITASRFDVPNTPGGQYLTLGQDSTATSDDRGDLYRISSYFGRINYSFRDRYLLTVSMRADGSSKFSDSWGYLPSVGIGWVISKENFMQSQKIFDNLKLRGSWGKIGNVSVPNNLAIGKVTQTNDLIYIGGNGSASTGASINTVVPVKTKWELGVGTDVALEASLIKNKLYVEIDWYNRKTKDAVFDIPVLGSVGTSSGTLIGNQATFQNRGLEFLATWKDAINKNWSYSVSANAATNHNKVLSVTTGGNPLYQYLGTSAITRTVSGQPIGQFFGRQVIGIFQSAADIANYKSSGGTVIQSNAKPGDFKFKDINDDGVIDDKDRTILGNPNPRFTYGINANVSYRNFDLTLDLQGVSGVEIYNGNFALRYGGENYTKDYYDNRWHGEGTSNTYPSVATSGNSSVTSSFYVEDGSYFRIRNVQLGYTFNKLKNSGISKLRLYVNAQNPCTWFHYRGFTPEVQGSPSRAGIDQQVYPLYATYNFGVNLTF